MSIGWVIFSTSGYADTRAAPAINQAQGVELVAVCSRDQDRGEAFAQKHGAKTAYTSVEGGLHHLAQPTPRRFRPYQFSDRWWVESICTNPKESQA